VAAPASSNRYVLALDQGTTSSRSLLFDSAGRIVALAQREFTQHFPRPGWVEHDAQEIYASQLATMVAVLRESRVSPHDIAAVGITNQRETTVLWDRATGEAVAPAIVWQDRRTAAICEALREAGHEPDVTQRTGLLFDPYFSGTKLGWLLDHVPGARARAERGELAFGTVDSWLLFKLSGHRRHVTDATNASRTLLFNLNTGSWDDELLALLKIPRACLPEIVDTCLDVSSAIEIEFAGVKLPVTGIAGDQQAALFGQGCVAPGLAKNTYGTGCFALVYTGSRPQLSRHRLLATVAFRRNGVHHYALEGGVFMGGATVQWLRDGLGIIQSSGEVEALASSVPDTGDVYLVPAFAGLGAPQWDAAARGTIIGLTRGSTRAHIARAAVESIAFQTSDLIEVMQQDCGHALAELRVDGGAARNDLLMQFQADLLGVPVLRPENTETTAFGAAAFAGLGVRLWESQEELASLWRLDKRFEPRMSRDLVADRRARWRLAVDRSRGWANPA
jgi:glycerol kinase